MANILYTRGHAKKGVLYRTSIQINNCKHVTPHRTDRVRQTRGETKVYTMCSWHGTRDVELRAMKKRCGREARLFASSGVPSSGVDGRSDCYTRVFTDVKIKFAERREQRVACT